MEEKNHPVSLVLTPILATSKISILALISGYCYKQFPSTSVPPILSTLVQLIEHGDPDERRQDLITVFFPSLNEILAFIEESVRSFFAESGTRDPAQIDQDVEEIHRFLLDTLWEITTLDTFHDFIAGSSRLLVENQKKPGIPPAVAPAKTLTSTSFLGRFVYNISVAFEVLVFDETAELWKTFRKYREESRGAWQRLHRGSASSNDDEVLAETELMRRVLENSGFQDNYNSSTTQVISQIDLAQMLEHQVQILQKYSPPPPESVKNILKLLSQSQRGIIPSAYYIEYLECWKQCDYEGSFNALHRYFDYMMSNRQQLFYHYALLSLATLHASFNSDDEALRAIDEAILVARENKDLDCLNYLLTWLFNFLKDKPHLYSKVKNLTTRDQILQFLKIKTKENRNWILQSMAYQYHALQFMLDGAPLRKVLENVTKASYILLNFEIGSNVKTTFVRNCQLSIANWSRVGVPALSLLYTDVALDACGSGLSVFDELTINMRKAILSYEMGHVDEALALFNSYEKLVVDDISLMKLWQSRLLLLKTDLWLKKCRYKPTSILLGKLKGQINEINDQDLHHELNYKMAVYQLSVNNCDEAIRIVSECLTGISEDDHAYNHLWFIEFQILYAKILTEYSRVYERALSVLLDALALAHESSLMTLVVKASLVLCDLLLKMDSENSAGDVEDILFKIMPLALQVGSLWLSSYGYYQLAKVLSLKLMSSNIPDTKTLFNKVLEYLESSITGFKKINDLKMMKSALEIEQQIAEFSNYQELMDHATGSLCQLDIRIQEESEYAAC